MRRALATALLATRVRPSGRFAARQLRRTSGVNRYRLRRAPYDFFLRHDGDDPFVLDECFGRLGAYEPPPAAGVAVDRIGEQPRVVDLGANIGLFGLLAIDRFPGATVLGFEADPANAELHRNCIEVNGLGERWRLINAFATTLDGSARFLGGLSSRSRAAAPAEAGAVEVEAVDVFPHLDDADLIKIDIEGGEWDLLADPRLGKLAASLFAIEYHGRGCPSDDPRAAAVAALESAGYRTEVVGEATEIDDPREGQGTVWAWRDRVTSGRTLHSS